MMMSYGCSSCEDGKLMVAVVKAWGGSVLELHYNLQGHSSMTPIYLHNHRIDLWYSEC